MSGQGAGLEVPWSRRHRERLLTEEVVPWSVVRTAADGVVRRAAWGQAGEKRWSLMSRAAPITPAVGPNSPSTMGRLPVARGRDCL